MITTKNRTAELRRTLAVLRQLNPAPLEILITADGCTDDTIQLVKAEMEQEQKQKVESGKQKTDGKCFWNGVLVGIFACAAGFLWALPSV